MSCGSWRVVNHPCSTFIWWIGIDACDLNMNRVSFLVGKLVLDPGLFVHYYSIKVIMIFLLNNIFAQGAPLMQSQTSKRTKEGERGKGRGVNAIVEASALTLVALCLLYDHRCRGVILLEQRHSHKLYTTSVGTAQGTKHDVS